MFNADVAQPLFCLATGLLCLTGYIPDLDDKTIRSLMVIGVYTLTIKGLASLPRPKRLEPASRSDIKHMVTGGSTDEFLAIGNTDELSKILAELGFRDLGTERIR